MSESNRTQTSIVEESTFGQVPVTPKFETLRVTEPSLIDSPETVTSDEIRSDRQIEDLQLVGREASATIGQELSFESSDTIIEGVMSSDRVNKPIRLNKDTAQITDVTVTNYNFTTGAAFVAGMMIQAKGFAASANNKIFEALTGSSATTIVSAGLLVDATPASTALLRQVGFIGATGDIVAEVAPNRLTSTVLDFNTMNLTPGQWLKVGGTSASNRFATAALNDLVRIKTVTTNSIELDIVPAGWVADTGAGLEIKTWSGDYIINGVINKSYSLEMQFLDHAPVEFGLFTGMIVDTFEFSLEAKSLITVSSTFNGIDGGITDVRTPGATDIAPATNTIYNASSNVVSIRENGVAVGAPNFIKAATVNVNNNTRRIDEVGKVESVAIPKGEFSVTGTLDTIFGDRTLYQKLVNNTESSFDFAVRDDKNQIILVDLPRMKFASGNPDGIAKNTDIALDMTYQAIRHPVLGYTMLINFFNYSEV